ncbi:MAG: helix-turn-helix transcriptional regulator [Cognatishimia sp.]|uniref:AraC family transcriptional regulator n=1 Tax=Cognatishimia sp. 1_MG-2023 TaxID=3062642 RepID=UPI0026E1C936|nr:AraC family transcriptional regulator [Cognatishimia sp. 1_MG-2023]MDO6725511.1 AraC family transcriptional regulator [Cognatishimia sp. 1_MG-2023]
MTNQNVRVATIAQLTTGSSADLGLMHVQTENLLLWTTRGQGVVNLQGERKGFGTHNAIFVPAGKIWSIEIGRQTLGQAAIVPDNVADAFPNESQLLRIQDGLAQSELTGLIEDMRREILQDRAFVGQALSSQATLLAIWLQRQMQHQPPAPKRKAATRLVRRFCDIAAAEYTSGKTMADFAEMLNVTPTHLTRVCRQSAGMTAADILAQCVIHSARKQLETSTTSFKAISEELGFASAAYFTRFIQQHCGATPTTIRQRASHKVQTS